MHTFIYKRTHCGDPNPEGQFGVPGDCMGEKRGLDFDAVIGVGGQSAKPKSLVRMVNWIGIGPHKRAEPGLRGPVVTFDHFLLFSPEGGEPAKKLAEFAPALEARLYENSKHFLMNDLSEAEQAEVEKILARAKNAPPSSADGAGPVTPSKGCRPRTPLEKSTKGCSSRPARRPAARTKC